MDPGDKILFDILKDLNRIGILRYLVLIGGRCDMNISKNYMIIGGIVLIGILALLG